MAPKESVLITGCSDGGIGSALALEFQKRGYHVFATARDPSKMSKLDGLSDVTKLKLDVVSSDDIKAAVAAVEKAGGTLNYLINNAARNHFMPALDEDLKAVRDLFEINFMAPIALTQAFAPLLIKAKGMAIYITSISGNLSIPYMGKTLLCTLITKDWVLTTIRHIFGLQKVPRDCRRHSATRIGPIWRRRARGRDWCRQDQWADVLRRSCAASPIAVQACGRHLRQESAGSG